MPAVLHRLRGLYEKNNNNNLFLKVTPHPKQQPPTTQPEVFRLSGSLSGTNSSWLEGRWTLLLSVGNRQIGLRLFLGFGWIWGQFQQAVH